MTKKCVLLKNWKKFGKPEKNIKKRVATLFKLKRNLTAKNLITPYKIFKSN